MVFQDMSADELNEMVADLKRKRREVIVFAPKTLKTLAILTVLKTYRHISADGSFVIKTPLQNLTNSMVQDFLQIMKSAHHSNNDLIFKKDLIQLEFVKGLMNRQISEVNLNEINSWCEEQISLADLKDCPNIRSITLWEDCLVVDKDYVFRHLPFDLLRNWRSLEVLSMRGYLCDDAIMKKIQFNLPNLKVLEFMVSSDSFSMKSVNHMAKLKKLTHLYVLALVNQLDCDVTDTIAHAAGKISQLQKIQFDGAISPKDFIETYVRFYPKKNLTIVDLVFKWKESTYEIKTSSGKFIVDDTTFEDGWPSNVAFEELIFLGSFPEDVLKIFKKQSMTVEKIKFFFSPVSFIYTQLEEFGSNITRLDILNMVDIENLNLLKVLMACPNLETLSFSDGCVVDNLVKIEDVGLSPLHFKNLKSLHYNHYLRQTLPNQYDEIHNILKLFLLGSEKHSKKLEIFSWQFETVLAALEEDPNCLNRLEEIVIVPGIEVSDVEMAEMLPLAFTICEKLVLRSPYLQKIHFMNLALAVMNKTRLESQKYRLFHSVARKINLKVTYDMSTACGIQFLYAANNSLRSVLNMKFILELIHHS